jgi:hypothetical protein
LAISNAAHCGGSLVTVERARIKIGYAGKNATLDIRRGLYR